MQLTVIDFLIGFFLMNAMPHMLFGLIGVRFLSAFGFSSTGNVAYAGLNVFISLALYNYQYGLATLRDDGIMLGALTMVLIYLLIGRLSFNLFKKEHHGT